MNMPGGTNQAANSARGPWRLGQPVVVVPVQAKSTEQRVAGGALVGLGHQQRPDSAVHAELHAVHVPLSRRPGNAPGFCRRGKPASCER